MSHKRCSKRLARWTRWALACVVRCERLAGRSAGLCKAWLARLKFAARLEVTTRLEIATGATAIALRGCAIATAFATTVVATPASITKTGLTAITVRVAARRCATVIWRALHTLAIVKTAAVVTARCAGIVAVTRRWSASASTAAKAATSATAAATTKVALWRTCGWEALLRL